MWGWGGGGTRMGTGGEGGGTGFPITPRPHRCHPQDGFVQNVHIPKVRVDPDGRCAVMLIYGTRLVVLPFRRDSLADEHEGLVGEG